MAQLAAVSGVSQSLCQPACGGTRSLGGWLRDLRCLRAGAGLLVGGLGPATACCRAMVVLC